MLMETQLASNNASALHAEPGVDTISHPVTHQENRQSEVVSSQPLPSIEFIPWSRQNLGILPPRSSIDTAPADTQDSSARQLSANEEDEFQMASLPNIAVATEDDVDIPPHKQRRKANKRLSRDERRDILLMRRLGHKYEDIAKFLGVTQAAVQYTINVGRASPEHHKAGRKKMFHPNVPKQGSSRRMRTGSGSKRLSRPESSNGESRHSAICPIPDEDDLIGASQKDNRSPEPMTHPINALHPIPD